MEFQSKWIGTSNGMSLKMECHLKWNVTQNGISLNMECHSKLNVAQNGMSLKFECHSNWKTKKIEKVVNPKTSNSASIGQISILFFFKIQHFNKLTDL